MSAQQEKESWSAQVLERLVVIHECHTADVIRCGVSDVRYDRAV